MLLTFNETRSVIDAPNFIRLPDGLSLPGAFSPFDIRNKVISPTAQNDWFQEVLESGEMGWQGLVCGDIESCRLLGLTIAEGYAQRYHTQWLRIGGSRLPKMPLGLRACYVVDSLVQFDGQLDPVRWGNIFDFCSTCRGKSTVIVLAPELSPSVAQKMSHLRPDYMWYLRAKQKREH